MLVINADATTDAGTAIKTVSNENAAAADARLLTLGELSVSGAAAGSTSSTNNSQLARELFPSASSSSSSSSSSSKTSQATLAEDGGGGGGSSSSSGGGGGATRQRRSNLTRSRAASAGAAWSRPGPLSPQLSRRRMRDETASGSSSCSCTSSPPRTTTATTAAAAAAAATTTSTTAAAREGRSPPLVGRGSPEVQRRVKAKAQMSIAAVTRRRGHRRSRSDPLSLRSFCAAPLAGLAEEDEEAAAAADAADDAKQQQQQQHSSSSSASASATAAAGTENAVPLIHHQLMARGNIPHLKLMSAHSPRKTLMNSIRSGSGPGGNTLRPPTTRWGTIRVPSPLSRSTQNSSTSSIGIAVSTPTTSSSRPSNP